MTKINNTLFHNFLTKTVDLDRYILTESMETIHRWNLFSRWHSSDQCDAERLCQNIAETFEGLKSLTKDEATKAEANLRAMRAKFGKRVINTIDFSEQGYKAIRCVGIIDNIIQNHLGVRKETSKRSFSSIAPSSLQVAEKSVSLKPTPMPILPPKGTTPSSWTANPASTTKASPQTPPSTTHSTPAKTIPHAQEPKKRTRTKSHHRRKEVVKTPTPANKAQIDPATSEVAKQAAAIANRRKRS